MACDWCGFGFQADGGLYACICRTPCGVADCSAPPKEDPMPDEPTTTDPMIAALLREREALVQHGLADRVKDVDEQLRLLGFRAPADEPKVPAARSTPPKGRRARGSETT